MCPNCLNYQQEIDTMKTKLAESIEVNSNLLLRYEALKTLVQKSNENVLKGLAHIEKLEIKMNF